MKRKYKIITLCGSMEHKKEFEEAYRKLTADGYIVIGAVSFCENQWYRDMYKYKIDMSDEIYVINAKGNIEEDVKLQIAYARERGKTVRFYINDTEEANAHYLDKFILIESMNISSRLRNILIRNELEYLYQVSDYCEEQFLKMKNMGLGTYRELRSICDGYGIHICSCRDLSDESIGIAFPNYVYLNLFKSGIRSKDDVARASNMELAHIVGRYSKAYKDLLKLKMNLNL